MTETPGNAGHKVQAHVLADEISLRAGAFSALPRSHLGAVKRNQASRALGLGGNEIGRELPHRQLVALYHEQVAATQADDPIEYGGHHLRDYFRSPLNPKSEAGADEMAQNAKSDGRS